MFIRLLIIDLTILSDILLVKVKVKLFSTKMKFIPSLTDLFIIWFLWLIGLKNVAYEKIKIFLLKKILCLKKRTLHRTKKYKNKICVENVWSEVEREMGFEEDKINITESHYELLTFCWDIPTA